MGCCMGIFKDMFSSVFQDNSSGDNDDVVTLGQEFHGGFNIDGTPMIDETIDINGDPYGCPSSLCDSSGDMSNDMDYMFDDEW
jgi:hypothetical protein